MNKTLLVLKHELITVLSRPSFLFVIFGIPIIGAIIFSVAGQLTKGSSAQILLSQLISTPSTVQAEGYIDQSGIIKTIPDSVESGLLLPFSDEGSARKALNDGEISAYYIIPVDYIKSGEIIYIRPDFNPLGSSSQSDLMQWILKVNLLGGDVQLANLINGPMSTEKVALSPEPRARCK